MRDRLSTKILSNGATRYGVYDETGNLLRYEYIKLEDEPTVEGDLFSKANMLPDSIPAALGLKIGNPQVKDALNVLVNIGNLHVWERVQSGVTDYLTSTDPNAYPKQSAAGGQDAYYTLGDVVSGSFYIGSFFAGSNSAVQYMVSDTPFVDESGSVSISNGTKVTFSNSLGDPGTESDAIAKVKALFAGKYVMRTNDPETDSSTMYYTLLTKNEVVYIPDDISVSVLTAITGSPNSMALSKYQPVTGHAAIPANTTITYLGQLGGGARIEVGSYVGTGTYGSSNPCSVSASFPIKQLIVFGKVYAGTGKYFPIYYDSNKSSYSMHDILLTTSFASRRGIYKGTSSYDLDYSFGKKSADGKTFSWYSSGNDASFQLNESAVTYYYIAIG